MVGVTLQGTRSLRAVRRAEAGSIAVEALAVVSPKDVFRRARAPFQAFTLAFTLYKVCTVRVSR